MTTPVLILGLLLFIIFWWKEWNGLFNKTFLLNLFLGFVAITSLLVLVLEPSLAKEQDTTGVLLTDGYQTKKLDSLKKVFPKLKITTYKKASDLSSQLDSVGEIKILGDGVPEYDFWQLQGKSVRYLEGENLSGIIRLKYNQELIEGDNFSVIGVYNQPVKGHYLLLQGPAGNVLDSISLTDSITCQFKLETKTKVEGNLVYKLVEKDSLGKEIQINQLPTVINKKEQLNILIINQFPSFETKYLKNFLSESGHKLVVRSQITKGKYKFEYLNTKRNPFYRFSKESLEEFDLVILDTDTYLGLSRSAKNNLSNASYDDGLGVFVQPDDQLFKRVSFFNQIQVVSDGEKNIDIADFPELKFEKYPYKFSDSLSLNGLALAKHSFLEYNGNGKIGTTTLKNTYQLVLDGHFEKYRQIWSQIITKVAKVNIRQGAISAINQFAFLDEPYSLEISSTLKEPVVIHADGYVIPLSQDPINNELWRTRTYPTKSGWNSVNMKNDSLLRYAYFVMDSTQWKTLRRAEIITKNQIRFKETTGLTEKVVVFKSLSRVWPFLCFLLSIGLLWLLPKLKR